MKRDSPDREYNREWLQYERQQPMYDESINEFYENVFKKSPVHNGTLDDAFKIEFVNSEYYKFDNNLKMLKKMMYSPIDVRVTFYSC